MSADRISVCPRCYRDAKPLPVEQMEPTLREYHDLGIGEDGYFVMDFRAACSVCDFEFEFSVKQRTVYEW